ncbi:uncharacterized protein LOC8272128 [Ricinus communis]|uniref:Copper ion binding protein n=1 Tax=Ricinus communis TaxID=3988 RepID=B9RBQ6_RICCO|nr:uncharacterized protein LOC8272128 [Ricinus communis]EEF50977.1 conserved hypothetical protein [Ricinus communis]|eukprot:XP_002509590.1 uncharacterized protein LOC8272128 [Ricinus communis]
MGDFSIQISPDLVNRLVNDGEKLKKKPRRTKPKIPRESARSQTKVNEKHDPEVHKTAPSPGWPVQPPLFFPVPPPAHSANTELDAIKAVIQESEKVLEKLQKQEESMVKEVTERAKDLRDKEFKLPYQKPMPCLADYDACRTCYKENGNDILKCAPLTRSYYDCVRRVKQQVSSADK